MVLVHFGAPFTARKSKILLKTEVSAKTAFVGISNNESPRSQKSQFFVKLSKKKERGPKLSLNFPQWGCAKGSSEILTQPIIGPSICTFWMPSFSF